MTTKIKAAHLSRKAIVYLRQSTLQQVRNHSESTTRQYGLQQRAVELGWPRDSVEIIDEDLGQSGSTTEGRSGFRRLVDDVARGRVGAIFALEVSRFARSSADWHALLDMCGWADVVICDEQDVYTPCDPNDSLLLGLKGQMSEAERHWLKARMQGAKLSRARRGELRIVPPTGYQWDECARRLCFDPDQQVRAAVQLIFDRFRIDSSASGVRRYFIENGVLAPARRMATGAVEWVHPRPRTILDILHNPIFAGAYVYGRRECRTRLVDGRVRRNRIELLPMQAWKVCIPDHHPAYISWEEYMDNQQRLEDNRKATPGTSRRGAARAGGALLQGLVLCGRCGYRMRSDYAGNSRRRYICRSPTMNGTGTGACWSVAATNVDAAVVAAFLDAAQPAELELALAVTREVERQSEELERQWQLRLERARYDATIAERRYKAVDPDNRVVARTLECDWEQRLRDLAEVEQQYQEARHARKVDLSDEDRARILELARDLPAVWAAESTSDEQRKRLIRILVSRITLSPVEVPERSTAINILWVGGAVTELTAPRPRGRSPNKTSEEAAARIHRLSADDVLDQDIADDLNSRGLRTGFGEEWTAGKVAQVRRYRGWTRPGAKPTSGRLPDRRADGLYSVYGVSAEFDVPVRLVRSWVRSGALVPTTGGGRGRPAWFRLDDAARAELRDRAERRKQRTTPGTGDAL